MILLTGLIIVSATQAEALVQAANTMSDAVTADCRQGAETYPEQKL
jgi:hypothetical protein